MKVIRCKQCGRFMSLRHGGQFINGKFMKQPKCSVDFHDKDICFDCHYWNEHVDAMTNHGEFMIPFVVEHHWYVANIDPEEKNSYFKGFGGAKIEVTFFDEPDKVHVYDNVWNGSLIPKRFWKQLPDTAKMKWL